jgi:thiamine biosynthesis lipoprotein
MTHGRLSRHHVEHVMGMAISMDFRDPVRQKVVDEIVRWFHEVDATYSTYKLESPVSQYGVGHLTRAELAPEINDVLALCETIRRDSDGDFDPWSVPAPNGSRFDPSGIVKGWAVECAAEMLESHDCANFCINAGGDIAVRGTKEPDVPWRIGVRHPYSPRQFAKVLEVSGPVGIATSAMYERAGHIINPGTGQPSAAIASATVVGPNLTFADAYATTVFVKGKDGLPWLQRQDRAYDAFIIYQDQTLATEGFFERVAAG